MNPDRRKALLNLALAFDVCGVAPCELRPEAFKGERDRKIWRGVIWGLCNWIGSGWCSGEGPWIAHDGELTDSRQLPHLSAGRGINRKLPHMSAGRGESIAAWFQEIADRLRNVRVACGDWSRVCGPSVLGAGGGTCGVFLDPPYASTEERASVYAQESIVGDAVREWCLGAAAPNVRIVLAGYDGEHNALEAHGWRSVAWKAKGGYGSQGNNRGRENATRERLWLSPHCVGNRTPGAGDALVTRIYRATPTASAFLAALPANREEAIAEIDGALMGDAVDPRWSDEDRWRVRMERARLEAKR